MNINIEEELNCKAIRATLKQQKQKKFMIHLTHAQSKLVILVKGTGEFEASYFLELIIKNLEHIIPPLLLFTDVFHSRKVTE